MRQNSTPRINGSRAFGVRPNAPVFFKVPAIGTGTLSYSASELPKGVVLNPASGVITGKIAEPGEYSFTITVTDDQGSTNRDRASRDSASRELIILVGENICLTPFMGWNSWYCHSELVSEQGVREMAEAFVSTGLVNHGWSYINIDDCWQAERRGDEALQANSRFQDMAALCDYVHGLGLKIGIYSTPWIGTYAGFSGGSVEPDSEHRKLAPEKRLQPDQVYGRFSPRTRKNTELTGRQWLFDKDARQWAEWGCDFVKLDWKPNDIPTTKRMYHDLHEVGRDIVISLSNAAPLENAEGLKPYAHALRSTGDIEDKWRSVSRNFSAQQPWLQYIQPGYWPDPDMLQVGNIGIPNRQNRAFKPTRLTRDEQRSQFSLWCLLSAPLLLSCDIASLDDFTLSLLTNDDAIDINQDYPAQPPVREKTGWFIETWNKPLYNGHRAVGVFNRACFSRTVTVDLDKLQLADKLVLDVWAQERLSHNQNQFTIPAHGVVLLKTVE